MKKFFLLWLWCLTGGAGLGGELRAGVAQVDITPPTGVGMAGYYSERLAEGTLDPLGAQAMVLEKDGVRAAVVTLDLISTTRGMVEATREAVEASAAVPGANVLICASHAHTGPVLTGGRGINWHAAGEATQRWNAGLPQKVAQAVAEAAARLAPAAVRAASGQAAGLTYNRRFFLEDGSVGWNPGKLNPRVVRPAGPTDPEVGLLQVDLAGAAPRPLALAVNFAMHPDTTGGTRWSADYPGALSRLVSLWRGEEVVTLFANGCSGNLNHIDVAWPEAQKGPAEAHRIGVILAAAVFQASKGLKPVGEGPLQVRLRRLELPVPPVDESEVGWAREVAEKVRVGEAPPFLEQVRAFRVLDIAAQEGRPLVVELQAISLGRDFAWLSLPGEVFVELGLAIKASSPFPHLHICELANGSIGYIPNHKAYAEGAYEVISARCADGSGEMMVDAAVELLRELHQAAR